MHIVLANQWFPPESGWGGVGMYNFVLARAYHALGHQVSVIAARPSDAVPAAHDGDGILVQRLRVRDAYRLRRLPLLGRYVRPLQQLAYSRRVAAALRMLHHRTPLDVVEFAEVGAEGFFYARAPQAAVVVRCHTPTAVLARSYTPDEMPFDTRLSARCEFDVVRRAHALTAPSHAMAKVIEAEAHLPAGAVHVIPNALPVSAVMAQDPALSPSGSIDAAGESGNPYGLPLTPDDNAGGTLTVLFVGRLDRVKGVGVLLAAVPEVLRACPAARFLFAGEDRRAAHGRSQRGVLAAQMTELGVSASVAFLGAVPQAELGRLYRAAALCVVPSLLYESFSYTCAQAMAAGKAVVASRSGGIPETVADGETGLLVAPGSVPELAAAIIRLLRDPELRARMGRAGRAKVAREYDPLRVARLNLDVYESARAQFRTSLTASH